MFDIGFWELFLVGLISLLVIGPQQLPKIARIIGFWLGKINQLSTQVKEELKEELHQEEIQQFLKKQNDLITTQPPQQNQNATGSKNTRTKNE
ncbi:MAG: Sec-independent protein translocase protein TatB [Methylococcales bacterium]|jgi:sec-independent protein translocase protein TatB|nr:twin-arginine translocase subunit TatB [Methylococcaceae bacterium]HIL40814.1 twin-arginine translocase subunit TatB [Methylococcales bacterium]